MFTMRMYNMSNSGKVSLRSGMRAECLALHMYELEGYEFFGSVFLCAGNFKSDWNMAHGQQATCK